MRKYLIYSLLLLSYFPSAGQDSTVKIYLREYPVLWQQTAAEYRALCYQAFNIASCRLNAIPKKKFKKQRLAIITDLDETILDNSYSEAQLIKDGKEWNNANWDKWTSRSAATGVPGAVEFLQEASRRGVTIFYISNRSTAAIQSTLLDLQRLRLPNADTAHMMFLQNTSSKETRRQLVMANYNVVMLLGDNLNDFTTAFEAKPIADRFVETDKAKQDWGDKFIVLPNSTYGEWENALYDYERGLSPAQKAAKRKNKLVGFQ